MARATGAHGSAAPLQTPPAVYLPGSISQEAAPIDAETARPWAALDAALVAPEMSGPTLQSMLAYEPQHRRAIHRVLAKGFPGRWPETPPDEAAFYALLCQIFKHQKDYETYRQVMDQGLLTRHPHWNDIVYPTHRAYLQHLRRAAAVPPGDPTPAFPVQDEAVMLLTTELHPWTPGVDLRSLPPLDPVWRTGDPTAWNTQVAAVEAAAAACRDAWGDPARLGTLHAAVEALTSLGTASEALRARATGYLLCYVQSALNLMKTQAWGDSTDTRIGALLQVLVRREALVFEPFSSAELDHWHQALAQTLPPLIEAARGVEAAQSAASGVHTSPEEALGRAQAWRAALEAAVAAAADFLANCEGFAATFTTPNPASAPWRLRIYRLDSQDGAFLLQVGPVSPDAAAWAEGVLVAPPPDPDPEPAPLEPDPEPSPPEPDPPAPAPDPAPVPAPARRAGMLRDPAVSVSTLLRLAPAAAPLPADLGRAGVWALLREDRLAQAYFLAAALEQRDIALPAPFCAAHLRVLAAARGLASAAAATDSTFLADLTALHQPLGAALDLEMKRAFERFCLAAALRPALLAPHTTGAVTLLRRLTLDLPSLEQVQRACLSAPTREDLLATVAPAADVGLPAQPGVVAPVQAAQRWRTEAPRKKFRYAPATHVWQHWLKPTEPLGRLLVLAAADAAEQLEEAEETLARWQEDKTIWAALDDADAFVRSRSTLTNPIEGQVRIDLLARVRDTLAVVADWVQWRRGAAPADALQSARAWQAQLRLRLATAAAEVQQQNREQPALPHQAIGAVLQAALADGVRWLEGTLPPAPELPVAQALAEPLLVIDSVDLDEGWLPDRAHASSYERDLLASATQPPDWVAAYGRALQAEDYRRTARLIAVIARMDAPTAAALATERDQDLRVAARALTQQADRLAADLSAVWEAGLCDATAYAALSAELACGASPATLNLARVRRALAQVAQCLQQQRARGVEQARTALLARSGDAAGSSVRARIAAVLAAGDVATAQEYAWRAEQGYAIPQDVGPPSPFGAFWPTFLEQIAPHCVSLKLPALPVAWAADATLAAYGSLDAALLSAWVVARRQQAERGAAAAQALAALMTQLGFTAPRVTPLREPGAWCLEVQPVDAQAGCPLPRYGSLAQGRYHLQCVADGVPLDTLAAPQEDPAPAVADAPRLVLVFGRLEAGKRREAARVARLAPPGALLLDEWLLLFLACQPPATRLAALFACTLPFQSSNPYRDAAAGPVPSELFTGRRALLADLHAPGGAHFLYGGRQLGKTTLLRELARRHHAPHHGQLAVWLDLENAGLGRTRPLTDLWVVIAAAVPAELAPAAWDPAAVARHLTGWLAADAQHRLRLLLDSADAFLAQAAGDDTVLRDLGAVLSRYPLQFQVVVASRQVPARGCQDALAAGRDPAPPRCLGPLVADDEAAAAFRLVATPLRALGFAIADDQVNALLAAANYQPNLLQDLLAQLLAYLQDPQQTRYDAGACPPYPLTAADLEAAFTHGGLRRFLRERFAVTLDADARYRCLTLLIALATTGQDPAGPGVARAWLWQEARRRWAPLFPDPDPLTFQAMLADLVGMGILRNTDAGYALRSPALRGLLPPPDEFPAALQALAACTPPGDYTPATYRRPLVAGRAGAGQRSPLLAAQEAAALRTGPGVVVVAGCQLTGSEQAPAALVHAAAREGAIPCWRCENAADLASWLATGRPQEPGVPPPPHLVIVSATVPWQAAHLAQAQAQAQAVGPAGAQPVRRWVFVAGPAHAWALSAPALAGGAVTLPAIVTLQPWTPAALARWWQDLGLGLLAAPLSVRLVARGALFHRLLADLGTALQDRPPDWRARLEQWVDRPPPRDAVADLAAMAPLWSVLTVLARYDYPASVEDLLTLEAGTDAALVARALGCGRLLGLIVSDGAQHWRLHPGLAALLVD